MSTLVTTHEGLERVVRGGQAVADMLGRRKGAPAGAKRREAGRGGIAAMIARWIERSRQYRQDRLFEQLMHDDPRVYADIQAARARAESR